MVGADARNQANWLYRAQKVINYNAESITGRIYTDRRNYPNYGQLSLSSEITVTGNYTGLYDVYAIVYAPNGDSYALTKPSPTAEPEFAPKGINTPLYPGWRPTTITSADGRNFFGTDLPPFPGGTYRWRLIVTRAGANVTQTSLHILNTDWTFTLGQ